MNKIDFKEKEEEKTILVSAQDHKTEGQEGAEQAHTEGQLQKANKPSAGLSDFQQGEDNSETPGNTQSSSGAHERETSTFLGNQSVVAGRYEILSLLGEGGMSRVFKARDKNTGAIVALKKILPERLQDEKSVERFLQESRVVEALNHRNIASTKEYGLDEDGSPYLVMEFVDGLTLAELIRQEGAIDIERALQIITQITDALSYAHGNGIIHRDIKPSNVILTRTTDGKDRVQIVDFGIARVFDHLSSAHMPLTQTGEALGTPWYMSPEQCFGKIADERSDIYQIGCLLQELLTGKRAFEGDTAFEVMFKHVTGAPTLEGIDANLQEILAKTLNKNPEDRYQSTKDLERDIAEYMDARRNGATNRSLLKQVESHSVFQITERRIFSAITDALLVGVLSAYITMAFTFSSLYRYWPSTTEPDDRFMSSFFAFLLGSINSVMAWPAAAFGLLPQNWIWDLPWTNDIPGMREANSFNGICLVPIITILVAWLYFAFFESSKLRGTPGKIIFGLKVQTAGPKRPGFWQASQRYFLKALSSLGIPELGRFVIGITKKGRSKAEQFTQQMRLPIYDSFSKCVIVKADRKKERKYALIGVAGLLGITLLSAAAPLLVYYKLSDPLILINPNYAPAYEVRADRHAEKKEYAAAAADYATVSKLNPKRSAANNRLMAVLLAQKKFDEALKVADTGWKSSEQNYDRATFLHHQTNILAQSKQDFESAIAKAKQITSRNLDRQLLAKLLHRAGHTEEAALQYKMLEDSLDRYVETFKDQPNDDADSKKWHHMRPEVFLNRAILLERNGSNEKALADLDRALGDLEITKAERAKIPNYFEYLAVGGPAHFYKGQILDKQGRPAEAKKEYESAVSEYSAFIKRWLGATHPSGDGYYALGQAYLGRAQTYRLLGKNDLASKDEKAAKDMGVNYYLDGEYPSWYTY